MTAVAIPIPVRRDRRQRSKLIARRCPRSRCQSFRLRRRRTRRRPVITMNGLLATLCEPPFTACASLLASWLPDSSLSGVFFLPSCFPDSPLPLPSLLPGYQRIPFRSLYPAFLIQKQRSRRSLEGDPLALWAGRGDLGRGRPGEMLEVAAAGATPAQRAGRAEPLKRIVEPVARLLERLADRGKVSLSSGMASGSGRAAAEGPPAARL